MSRGRLAFAVFGCGRLDFYAGKTLRQYRFANSRNKALTSILKRLVLEHRTGTIALPRLNVQQRRSADLRGLHRTVLRFCLKERLVLRVLDPAQFFLGAAGSSKPTKADVRQRLLELYPELARFDRNRTEWERRYYGHVFTAIGCGLATSAFDDSEERLEDRCHG